MRAFMFRTIVLAGFVLTSALLVQAQATRTWVSGVGDDSNPCSRTAPCKSFAGALSKTAVGGEINCLTPGGYLPVTISNSITIDCTGNLGGITVPSGGTGITINAAVPSTVRLRGLTINGQSVGTTGISITGGQRIIIEDVAIDGFVQNGISLTASSNIVALYISNSSVTNNKGNGIIVTPSGTFYAISTIFNSVITGNNIAGISSQMADIMVTNCMISGNATGISAIQNGSVRIAGSTVSKNGVGLSAQTRVSGAIISFGNNVISGNVTTDGSPTSTLVLQ